MLKFVCFLMLITTVACERSPEGTQDGDCTDKVDNDKNGFVDCEDTGCKLDDICLQIAAKSKATEEKAKEMKEKEEIAAKKKAVELSDLNYFEMGSVWVQKGHNGVDVDLKEAESFCKRLKIVEKEDWRLPTKLEAVAAAKSGKLKPEAFAMWTSAKLSKKRGVIVGITSGAANELGVRFDGQCRARCVHDK